MINGILGENRGVDEIISLRAVVVGPGLRVQPNGFVISYSCPDHVIIGVSLCFSELDCAPSHEEDGDTGDRLHLLCLEFNTAGDGGSWRVEADLIVLEDHLERHLE